MNSLTKSIHLSLAEHALNQGELENTNASNNYYELSIIFASKAIEEDVNFATAYQLRAKAYFYLKQYDQALQDYYKSAEIFSYLGRYAVLKIKQKPAFSDIDMQIAGLLYSSAPQQHMSGTDAELAVKDKSIDLALTYNRQGEYQKALKTCRTVLQLNPYDVLAYGCQLVAHERLHIYEAALLDCLVLRVIDKARDNIYQIIEANLFKQLQQQNSQQKPMTSQVLISPMQLPATPPNQNLNNLSNTSTRTPEPTSSEGKRSTALIQREPVNNDHKKYQSNVSSGIHKKPKELKFSANAWNSFFQLSRHRKKKAREWEFINSNGSFYSGNDNIHNRP